MDSSNIASVGYDALTRTLEVEFKGRNGSPGAVYQYEGVPPDLPPRMMAAPSVGAFLNQLVKPVFKSSRV